VETEAEAEAETEADGVADFLGDPVSLLAQDTANGSTDRAIATRTIRRTAQAPCWSIRGVARDDVEVEAGTIAVADHQIGACPQAMVVG
jgi:hypothetical protein